MQRARACARWVTGGIVGVTVLTGLGAGLPALAAPPPVTHTGVVNPDPIDVTPHVLGGAFPEPGQRPDSPERTEAVLDLGHRVIVGGNFTQVKRYNQPAVLDRPYLFAYDKATGAIDATFNPRPDGRVKALLLGADGKVLVAGQFKNIAGQNIPYLAKLDPVTGAATTAFRPAPAGMVYDLHLAGGHLYIGGSFTKVGTTTRTNFAVLDPATGAPRPGPDVAFTDAPVEISRVERLDVTPNGGKLVAIGNFARVGGQARADIAVLDLTADGRATVSGWRTDRYADGVCGPKWATIIYDVDISPDGTYFVVVTTGGPGGPDVLCDSAARWETAHTGPAQPTWVNHSGGDSLTAVAVTGAAVYVAGHQRWADNPEGRDRAGAGAVARQGIAALHPTTGKALPWNPGRERGWVVSRLVATAEGLYVLSDSSSFAGEWHPRLSYLTLTGQNPVPPPPPPPPPPTGVGPFPSADAFTTRQYRDILGRQPTSAELATVRSRLAAGQEPSRVIADLLVASGLPRRAEPITRLYRAYFLRLPDRAGLDYWLSREAKGTSLRTMSRQFAGSAEFTRLYGKLDDRGFVRLVYRNVLDRAPDQAGVDYWVRQLGKGASRGSIMVGFSESGEYKRATALLTDVVVAHHALLGSMPAPDLAPWNASWTATGLRGVLGQIFAGAAYAQQVR